MKRLTSPMFSQNIGRTKAPPLPRALTSLRDSMGFSAKGQLISKGNCQVVNFSKKRTKNSFLLVCAVFSFVFWKRLKGPKIEDSERHFEII